ncbi:MAG: excisionase family DNA-binding protein [Longimicrobiales bacterium]|nr:excisionase family DNA-binding protein [Longimicrobiales bacterium]
MSAERFNSDLFLTTSQVADLLDVHGSTVKRWCNEGELAFEKTGGGHRRIHLSDALALARARDIPTFLAPFAPYEGHVWSAVGEAADAGSFQRVHALAMGWLMRGRVERLGNLFLELARHPRIPFSRFADDAVGGFMRQIGDAWRSGQLRVGEEHMLSERIIEVLHRHRSEVRVPVDAPAGAAPAGGSPAGGPPAGGAGRAVVGSMEGVRHSLGALCVRLGLERLGWEVVYLGADVPVEDFAAMQVAREASLVAVSFAPPGAGADMKRCVRILAEFYQRERPYALALGGQVDDEPDFSGLALPFSDFGAFTTLAGLEAALADGFGRRVAA